MKKLKAYLSKCGLGKYSCKPFKDGIIIPWNLVIKVNIQEIKGLLPEGWSAIVAPPRNIDMLECTALKAAGADVEYTPSIIISRGADSFAHLDELDD